MCGSRQIRKLLSAPHLNLSPGRASAAAPAGEGSLPEAGARERLGELQGRLLQGLRKLIDETEDVGERFAEEARRIHFNEAPPRAIRGVATPEDARALSEEGIDVVALPLPPALKGPLQ